MCRHRLLFLDLEGIRLLSSRYLVAHLPALDRPLQPQHHLLTRAPLNIVPRRGLVRGGAPVGFVDARLGAFEGGVAHSVYALVLEI